jgi:hypothetical protein
LIFFSPHPQSPAASNKAKAAAFFFNPIPSAKGFIH